MRLYLLNMFYRNNRSVSAGNKTYLTWLSSIAMAAILLMVSGLSPAQESADSATLARWIAEMKTDPKGPFERIVWFCKDGQILPPKPYACAPYGGGRQHGEWNERTKTLRAAGYYVANVLAALEPVYITDGEQGRMRLKHLLLERYLMAVDGGWIFRRTGEYRGALQIESEIAGARRLLATLNGAPYSGSRDFMLRRDTARLLPHGPDLPSLTEVRQRSTDLAEADPGFALLRNKIHGQPDAQDAGRVRAYAQARPLDAPALDFEGLAAAIDLLYRPVDLSDRLLALAGRLQSRTLAGRLRQGAEILSDHLDAETRFDLSSELLTAIREAMAEVGSAERQRHALDLSLALELEAFRVGTVLVGQLPQVTRATRLAWLRMAGSALYGSGLISTRQWRAIQDSLQRLSQPAMSLADYREQLRYLARVPAWVSRWQQFHYGEAIEQLAAIEPQVRLFIAEQLRASPLVIYSNILDSLVRDANALAQIPHRLFGEPVGTGLRSLNPGLARGVLKLAAGDAGLGLVRDGIYLLPATTAELSPVAGILTLGEGNALSHVQILASNLGIPNVAVDQALVADIESRLEWPVVLAVSPGGRVFLEEDGPSWDEVFGRQQAAIAARIRPELDKLDLGVRSFLRLEALRASDSGRLAGPKAANLGELKQAFPQLVPGGIVIPFGVFRQLLEQELEPGGESVFAWMQAQYRALERLADRPQVQERARQAVLARLRAWIEQADPGEAFRSELRRLLEQSFGPDGSYALFVRSDTNMEDLPGFSGAGLNLTVPNVVGFDQVLQAISRVWASPFSERASAWRQERMEQPEHVYASVLLMRSVPVDKSGVMVTMDVESGRSDRLTVAVNEGVGGAVAGQAAEELRIEAGSGAVQLLAEATSPVRRLLDAEGGLRQVPVSGRERVLEPEEITQLLAVAAALPERFPQYDDQGRPAPADVEFGFERGRLVLFQIRPFVGSRRALENQYLIRMDAGLEQMAQRMVRMDAVPEREEDRQP